MYTLVVIRRGAPLEPTPPTPLESKRPTTLDITLDKSVHLSLYRIQFGEQILQLLFAQAHVEISPTHTLHLPQQLCWS